MSKEESAVVNEVNKLGQLADGLIREANEQVDRVNELALLRRDIYNLERTLSGLGDRLASLRTEVEIDQEQQTFEAVQRKESEQQAFEAVQRKLSELKTLAKQLALTMDGGGRRWGGLQHIQIESTEKKLLEPAETRIQHSFLSRLSLLLNRFA